MLIFDFRDKQLKDIEEQKLCFIAPECYRRATKRETAIELLVEEYKDNQGICNYCPIPVESQGVRCYGGVAIMCEGGCCPEAEQALRDAIDENPEEYDIKEEEEK